MSESLELAVLSDVVSRFESAGFEYLLTGSVAMNYYSQPRMTRDIDIVVSLVESDTAKELWIVSKEDLILSKLFWARDSRSEMQLGDARNLLSTQPDLDYLRRWSSALGVDHLLQECIDE